MRDRKIHAVSCFRPFPSPFFSGVKAASLLLIFTLGNRIGSDCRANLGRSWREDEAVVLDQYVSRKPSKRAQKITKKIQSSTWIQSADRPEIEFQVACDVIEFVNFSEFHGFCDVTAQATLNSISGRSGRLIVSRCGSGLLVVNFRALSEGYIDKNYSSTQ